MALIDRLKQEYVVKLNELKESDPLAHDSIFKSLNEKNYWTEFSLIEALNVSSYVLESSIDLNLISAMFNEIKK